jgi:hypothetical protein
MSPHGGPGKSNDPQTWGTRAEAEARARATNGAVGIMLGEHEGIALGGLDLDSCFDPETGNLEAWAQEAIDHFGSYAEVSPSGEGVKVFFAYEPGAEREVMDKARRAFTKGDHRELAIDLAKRYYAVTGDRLDTVPCELALASVDQMRWVIEDAGPRYVGKTESASKTERPRDESRSGRAYQLAMELQKRGEPFEAFEAVLEAEPNLADWAQDERQVLRTWRNTAQYRPLSADNLASEFEDLPPLKAKAARSKLSFLSPTDCENAPARGYLVKGLIAPGDVSCIFGAPGAGKSVIAPHIAYAVAQGRQAFGMRTKQGGVLYVAAEDPTGMRGRVKALCRQHGDAPEFALVEGLSNLGDLNSGDFSALMDAVKQREPKLIFIDTLAMAFPGLDENSAEAMSLVVKVATKLASSGAAVILIHHDTKSEGGTPRGHSILNGALFAAVHVKKDEVGVVRGRLTKNRNGPCDRDLAFKIEAVELGVDEDGDPITAPIAEECQPGPQPVEARLSKPSRIVLETLRGLLADADFCPDNARTGEDGATLLIPDGTLRDACIQNRALSGSEKVESRKRVFRRAIQELAGQDLIVFEGDNVRLATPFDDIGLKGETS